MNGKLIAEAEELRAVVIRLSTVGLIVDRTALSQESRRAAFALQCLVAATGQQMEQARYEPIGFEYPNAR